MASVKDLAFLVRVPETPPPSVELVPTQPESGVF